MLKSVTPSEVKRLIFENKRLLLLVVLLCAGAGALHFMYNRYWRTNHIQYSQRVRNILTSIGKFELPSSWNSTDNSTDAFEDDKAVDVHIENPVLGHTGEVASGKHSAHNKPPSTNVTTIAIGGGITSKGVRGANENNIAAKFQLFYTFLPTFCKTASPGFHYHFYFAYDRTDSVFSNPRLLSAFQQTFQNEIKRLCERPRKITSSVHLVQCNHTGKPGWAQNDAMLEAYLDNMGFYYRVNDDTRMESGGWLEAYINVLDHYDPPLVGVVGPNHRGGNTNILTYDFVHRTHIDIFGFYYPRLFTDWWADDWVTYVYKPKHSTKLMHIRLAHTRGMGKRYNLSDETIEQKLAGQLQHDTKILNRYIEAVKSNKASGVKPYGRKVISVSLYGKGPRYTWGVIRNAQLVPVFLPEWTLRVYVAADPPPPQLAVPSRILNKLRLLGVEIAHVPTGRGVMPRDWRLLAASDRSIDYFLIRDADGRLSEREAAAVRDWVSAAEKNGPRSGAVHCIRDHPKHAEHALVDGLWGGRPAALRRRLKRQLVAIYSDSTASAFRESQDITAMLSEIVWPAVADVAYCHDSVSACDRWMPLTSRHSFSLPRSGQEYVGEKYNGHMQLVSKDSAELTSDVVCPNAELLFSAVEAG